MKRSLSFVFFLLSWAASAAAPAPVFSQVSVASAEYTVGVGDVIVISVLQPERIDQTTVVNPDGTISFPYVGSVRVSGLTLPQIQEEIQKRLADGYMKYPVVAVSLSESRSRKFFVYGDVVHPGGYPFEEGITVLRAISTGGGFSKGSISSRVKVLRSGKEMSGYETIDVKVKEMLDGISGTDIVLRVGDVINVSESKFFVYGEVMRPGVYPLEEGITVLKAISIAGGFSRFGSASRVKVLRTNPEGAGYETIKVNLKAVVDGAPDQDVILQPEDTVVVSEGIL
jgi:polysaccharide export outer membrane protein